MEPGRGDVYHPSSTESLRGSGGIVHSVTSSSKTARGLDVHLVVSLDFRA